MKITSESKSLYTLAVIIIKFISKLNYKIICQKTPKLLICFTLFSHQFSDRAYGSFMI